MANETGIFWLNEAEQTRFGKHGFDTFDDFWRVEDSHPAFTRLCRKHEDRYSGKVCRWTIRLEVDGDIYFLKRACGRAFRSVLNEFEAINALKRLNIKTADVVSQFFDYEAKQGFLLLKNLDGYVAFQDLATAKASDELIQRFAEKKDRLLDSLLSLFFQIRNANYCYPDWRDKHIFFNLENNDIALIDLERLTHISKFPWYYRFKLFRAWKYDKERRTLFRSLTSGFYSEEALDDAFNRLEQQA